MVGPIVELDCTKRKAKQNLMKRWRFLVSQNIYFNISNRPNLAVLSSQINNAVGSLVLFRNPPDRPLYVFTS